MTDQTPSPIVDGFYEPQSGSIQYVVADPATGRCAIIDPVLDFDPRSGMTATLSADRLLEHIAQRGWQLEWILDTHPHADHFTAADYLRSQTGAPIAIGEKVREMQTLWKRIYNFTDVPEDGSQWDRLFRDGDSFTIGTLPVRVMLSPGHTLASITYIVGDAAFVHDTLFMPDSGTARADFPGGSSAELYRSISAILALPPETRIFVGHDYQPGGRPARWESTVAEQRETNTHMSGPIDEAAYVALRDARDNSLPMPALILMALQVNLNAGRLPAPEANGMRYLKYPLNALGGRWHE